METLTELINSMISSGILKSPHIIKAFETIDRKHFVPTMYEDLTYIDAPLSIGEGQTISQPSTVAFMLEHLSPQKGDKILDIGTGSGWTTALLCTLVGEEGSVTGFERVDSLVKMGQENLSKFYKNSHCSIQKATEVLGKPEEKFDKILVSAGAEELPETLISQLNIGGRVVIPIKSSIIVVSKHSDESIETKNFYGFRFVPLIY